MSSDERDAARGDADGARSGTDAATRALEDTDGRRYATETGAENGARRALPLPA